MIDHESYSPTKANGQSTYFIQAGEHGPIKIGVAADPQKRKDNLQIGCHEELRLVGIIECNIEEELHHRYAAHRIRGEWFYASVGLVNFIKKNRVAFEDEEVNTQLPPNKMLTVSDAAEYVRVENTAILQWINNGSLIASNVCRSPSGAKPRWRIDRSDLMLFLETRNNRPLASKPSRRPSSRPGQKKYF